MNSSTDKRYRHEGKCVFDLETGMIAPTMDTRTAAVLSRSLNEGTIGPEKLRWKVAPELDSL